jgi:hypothetical protein
MELHRSSSLTVVFEPEIPLAHHPLACYTPNRYPRVPHVSWVVRIRHDIITSHTLHRIIIPIPLQSPYPRPCKRQRTPTTSLVAIQCTECALVRARRGDAVAEGLGHVVCRALATSWGEGRVWIIGTYSISKPATQSSCISLETTRRCRHRGVLGASLMVELVLPQEQWISRV